MLRALLGPLLFLALGAAGCVGLHRLRLAIAPAHDMELLRIERLLEHADRVEALSVGSSHSLAIDFQAAGVPGYHVWTLGQDLFEVESQLRWLLPRLPALKTLVFAVSYGSFHRDNGACTDKERGMARRDFYASSPGYGRIADDSLEWFKGIMTSQLVTPDHWGDVLAALVKRWQGETPARRQYRNEMYADGRFGSPSAAVRDDAWLANEARTESLPRHMRLQQNMLDNSPDLPERAAACFGRILDLAEQHGLRVIFYTPPYHPAYVAGFDAATRQATLDTLAHFVATRGIEYHDYSQDEAFVGCSECFVNSDHLSPEGSRRFSTLRIRPLLAPEGADAR